LRRKRKLGYVVAVMHPAQVVHIRPQQHEHSVPKHAIDVNTQYVVPSQRETWRWLRRRVSGEESRIWREEIHIEEHGQANQLIHLMQQLVVEYCGGLEWRLLSSHRKTVTSAVQRVHEIANQLYSFLSCSVSLSLSLSLPCSLSLLYLSV